jgi:hypothetical protein
MPREEPRGLVEGLVGLVQFPEVELEDVRAFWGHLQGHINVVPGDGHRPATRVKTRQES